MANSIYNYYEEQINNIGNPKSGFAAKVQITSDKGKTKWLSLNDESASLLVKFLSEHYNITK